MSSQEFRGTQRYWRMKGENDKMLPMDEGRKRVLAIVAGILVARHLKTTDEFFDTRPSPRNESLVASAILWAEKILKRIDNSFPSR